MIYAAKGEIVSCEQGHEVASVASDMPMLSHPDADALYAAMPFGPLVNFRGGNVIRGWKHLGVDPWRCRACGSRYMKPILDEARRRVVGYRLFISGNGWRGERRYER